MADNRITKVTIVGASGRIGGAFASALLGTGKHEVTVLSRSSGGSSLPAGAKVVEVDYDSEDSLVNALTGQQFLAITLGVRAPPDLHSRIVAAAAKAGVPYIMPNVYGSDPDDKGIVEHDAFPGADKYHEIINGVKASGASCIVLCCGFWYEWSLAMPEPWYGFDINNRTVTLFDDSKTKINTSTWDQCGRAFAALLSLPISGQSPCIDDWKNKPVYIDSFKVSQRDMLDSLHRVLGTSDADWKITYEPSVDRYKRGIKDMQSGNMTGLATAMYSRVFYQDGTGDYESKYGLQNDVLGLPKEDFDEITKRAADMAKDGFAGKVFRELMG